MSKISTIIWGFKDKNNYWMRIIKIENKSADGGKNKLKRLKWAASRRDKIKNQIKTSNKITTNNKNKSAKKGAPATKNKVQKRGRWAPA